jgi:hypothetical protein
MPSLSNPTLSLKLVAGTSKVDVTGSVKVSFSPTEETLIKLLSLKYSLKCRIWAEDSGFNGENDPLFSISSQTVNADGTHTFKRTVDRSSLDEDWEGNDEVFARYLCTPPSNTGIALTSAPPVRSGTITGNF